MLMTECDTFKTTKTDKNLIDIHLFLYFRLLWGNLAQWNEFVLAV